MSKLYSVGELLIDFQSVGTAGLKDTSQFVKNAGGAPANACVQAVKLGQSAAYLTMVGDDGFGEFLIESLKNAGVDTRYIKKTRDYDTSLAFVSFKEGGEREFSFYRRAAADLHFTPQDFKDVEFEKDDILEFGSVALKTEDARATHISLIERARSAEAVICFDPNLRFNLWESEEELRDTVREFGKFADVIKVGEDELEFISGLPAAEAAGEAFRLWGNLKVLLVTNGGKGAKAYTADGGSYFCAGYKVKAVDTTGAGDSFFGAFIAQLMEQGLSDKTDLQGALSFACKCGAYTTTNFGAIPAMGDKKTVERAVK